MFHGGGMVHHHPGGGGAFDADEVLGKVYDSKVMSRLPRYLAPVRAWISVGAGGMIVRSLATLALPYLVGRGTDHFIRGDLSGLNLVALIFAAAALAMWGGQFLETKYLSSAGQRTMLL